MFQKTNRVRANARFSSPLQDERAAYLRMVPASLVGSLAILGASQANATTYNVSELPFSMSVLPVPQNVTDTVTTALPEGRNVDAAFLNPSYTPYLTVSEDANVWVTFIDEGAGYRNSLGYYTFDGSAFDGLTKSDVDTNGSGVVSLSELAEVDGVSWDWIFPNSSKQGAGGQLSAGDTVALNGGEIVEAGQNIGFFLSQNSWSGSGVSINDGGGFFQDQVFYSQDFLNPEAPDDGTIDDSSYLDRTRHVAMLFADAAQTALVLGFEDLNRVDRSENDYGYSSDEDFNDAVFFVTANPPEALHETNVPIPAVPLPSAFWALALGMAGLFYVGRKQGRQRVA